jgi:hypothetical protein
MVVVNRVIIMVFTTCDEWARIFRLDLNYKDDD